ncbi:MAG TPA: MFS transporter [Candidatus Nanopelagicales bacterium]
MPVTFTRTRLSWLLYATNGAAAFFIYAVGPATPLIAKDLGISLQLAALHGTASAASLLLFGVVGAPVIRRLGRPRSIRAALLTMTVGALLLILAPMLAVSLLGVFLAGLGTALASTTANATLADAYRDAAPTVLTESNAAAGWVGLLAPLFMGLFLAAGLGWRVGLAVSIPLFLALAVIVPRAAARAAVPAGEVHDRPPAVAATVEVRVAEAEPVVTAAAGPAPAAQESAGPGRHRPRVAAVFWVVMAAVFAAAGAEFGVNYWGATLLAENSGAATGAVTAAMSAPIAGVAVGRTLGARVALHVPAHRMLVAGWLLALVGFVGFWLPSSFVLATIGLFVIGLGLSVIYPLLLDRAVLLAPGHSDWALSVSYPFVGIAIGTAPFVLGTLAAAVGVSSAFLLVPLLMAMGLGAVVLSRPGPPGT